MLSWLMLDERLFSEPVTTRRYIPEGKRDRWTHPFACNICTMRFTIRSSATRHEKEEHKSGAGIKKHICGVCGYDSIRKADFMRHMRVHAKKKELKCALCGKLFGHRRNLQRHHRLFHAKKKKKFRCSMCGYTTPRRDALRRHKRKIHQCDVTTMRKKKRRKID